MIKNVIILDQGVEYSTEEVLRDTRLNLIYLNTHKVMDRTDEAYDLINDAGGTLYIDNDVKKVVAVSNVIGISPELWEKIFVT